MGCCRVLAVTIEFNPVRLIKGFDEEFVSIASNSLNIISEYASKWGTILEDREELFRVLQSAIVKGDIGFIVELIENLGNEELYELVDKAKASIDKYVSILRELRISYKQYRLKVSIKDPALALIYISCLLRLAFLYTRNITARDASIISYVGAKIVSILDKSMQEAARAALYYYSSSMLYLNGYKDEALALLGWGLRNYWRIKPRITKHITEKPSIWFSTLYANYYMDIAPLVDGKLLEAWGYYKLLEKMRQND